MAYRSRCATRDILDAVTPFLRRYGRALSGCQNTGDTLAAQAKQAARQQTTEICAASVRILLFKCLHQAWSELSGSTMSKTAAWHRMTNLTPNSREVLLLRAIEEFSFIQIGEILGINALATKRLFEIAVAEMPYRNKNRVLIIEDDIMLAMDMSACLSDMGCIVTGVARTAEQAVELAATSPPELIIASLVLADRSSGLDAASRITRDRPDINVVFVTPHPERLLTGDTQEPVFIITKPYFEDQVRSVVSQSFILSSALAVLGRPGARKEPRHKADDRQ